MNLTMIARIWRHPMTAQKEDEAQVKVGSVGGKKEQDEEGEEDEEEELSRALR